MGNCGAAQAAGQQNKVPESKQMMQMRDQIERLEKEVKKAKEEAKEAANNKGPTFIVDDVDSRRQSLRQMAEQIEIGDTQPSAISYCMKHFPTSVTNPELEKAFFDVCSERGFTDVNTLFAHATCPDEVNYDEEDTDLVGLMHKRWGEKFTLGGLAGFPFAGKTGWGAFSAHTPEDGNIALVFAPHIGVGHVGELGKLLRAGQHHDSTCCGAAVAAYGTAIAPNAISVYDPQQNIITKKLLERCPMIKYDPEPMLALAYSNFDACREYIREILNIPAKNCNKIAIIGGIMVNLEDPHEDRFVPLLAECIDCHTGEVENFLHRIPTPNDSVSHVEHARERAATFSGKQDGFSVFPLAVDIVGPANAPEVADDAEAELKVCLQEFPNAWRSRALEKRVFDMLTERGFTGNNTTFASSVCPCEVNYDEVETDLILILCRRWSEKISIGGDAGFAFAGKSGWAHFSERTKAHAPEDGRMIVVFASHVGIGTDGKLGFVRNAQGKDETCCPAAWSAWNYKYDPATPIDVDDPQQHVMAHEFAKWKDLLPQDMANDRKMVWTNYHAARDYMRRIISNNVAEYCKSIAILGGIMVNLPGYYEDRFVPLTFDVMNCETMQDEDLCEAAFGQRRVPDLGKANNFRVMPLGTSQTARSQ